MARNGAKWKQTVSYKNISVKKKAIEADLKHTSGKRLCKIISRWSNGTQFHDILVCGHSLPNGRIMFVYTARSGITGEISRSGVSETINSIPFPTYSAARQYVKSIIKM